jgi:hypothetical protein
MNFFHLQSLKNYKNIFFSGYGTVLHTGKHGVLTAEPGHRVHEKGREQATGRAETSLRISA